MTLLVTPAELTARRTVAHGPLNPLAASLAADLEPVVSADLLIPPEKAQLSREGGRCPRDGVLLEFDPLSPRAHRCPMCGETYTGEPHYRFWIYWYQMWLAERAVHGAALSTLGFGDRYAAFARSILEQYAASYANYPNSDNVLGPSRLFFSTYLESIWLLQICVATDLLEQGGDATTGGMIRDRIIAPSRAIIAGYDEQLSNRQVWNNVALLASAQLLGDDAGANAAVYRESGVIAHLGTGLLGDGSWYEGENYHLFAHRGLWYAVTIADRAGLELPQILVDRFQEGFAIPFATALPDVTLPSRRDSQYAISLRQWRIAEHCELGYARDPDARLSGALRRLYIDDLPRRDTGRRWSSADVERNMPPTSLSRADLSWRALLHAQPELELTDDDAAPPPSALLEGQGIAVFRRETGRGYVALDYGHHGGGHGHPDRLNVLLAHGDTRWLDDMGTGSYVDPSLHWYRSTLAHNAPLVNGHSQIPMHGNLLAYDERDTAGWIMASADSIAPGASAVRTLVVMDGYLIDELEWQADKRVTVDLPIHVDARIVTGADQPSAALLTGGDELEDGFNFVRDSSVQNADAGVIVELGADAPTQPLHIWWTSDRDTEWWRAVAPGPPGKTEQGFRVARANGETGVHRSVWSWTGVVTAVALEPLTVTLRDGTRHEHRRTDDGWEVAIVTATERRALQLRGVVEDDERDSAPTPALPDDDEEPQELFVGSVFEVELDGAHYRRSEQSWDEAGRPAATVSLEWTGQSLLIGVDVQPSERTFVAIDAVNPFDNELPDVNGDGVQLYLRSGGELGGWMLVPERDGDLVRSRPIDGWPAKFPISADWEPTEGGYHMDIVISIDVPRSMMSFIGLDVIINEKPSTRSRRRGQLVLSGADGEFVYLRGDRHEPDRLIPFILANA